MSAGRTKVETFGRLVRGDVVKLHGEHGTFRFMAAVHDAAGELLWIDLYGGIRQREMSRSVSADRVKVPSERELHRQRRLRAERAAA